MHGLGPCERPRRSRWAVELIGSDAAIRFDERVGECVESRELACVLGVGGCGGDLGEAVYEEDETVEVGHVVYGRTGKGGRERRIVTADASERCKHVVEDLCDVCVRCA